MGYRERVKYPPSGIIGMAGREGTVISEPFQDNNGQSYVAVDWDFTGNWDEKGMPPPSDVTVERLEKLTCIGHVYYE